MVESASFRGTNEVSKNELMRAATRGTATVGG